jgi:hypothetical protein
MDFSLSLKFSSHSENGSSPWITNIKCNNMLLSSVCHLVEYM